MLFFITSPKLCMCLHGDNTHAQRPKDTKHVSSGGGAGH